MVSFSYRETAPPASLAPFVRTLWRLEAEDRGDARERVEPVFPDGCVELVFHLAEPFAARADGGALVRQDAALLAGPSTAAVHLARGAASDVVGIRFEPGGAAALGLPPLERLRDTIVPLDALGLASLTGLRDALVRTRSSGRFERLTRALADCCHARSSGRGSVDALRASSSVKEAASAAGVSTRQFERAFVRDVGMSPRELKAIERFQRALRMVDRGGRRLADVAQLAGYSDEPHLCREFRRFAGTTAGAYAESRAPLTAAFSAAFSPSD